MTSFDIDHPLKTLPMKQFLLPSMAGSCAVVFSHPMDLTKTRLQLDNELAKRGSPRSYKGILDCLQHNFNNYGIRGLQRGLQFGVLREFLFTGSRVGFYDPVLRLVKELNGSAQQTSTAAEMFLAGQSVGALSGALVNPVEVLKIRNQALGGLTGHQHAASSAGGAGSAGESGRRSSSSRSVLGAALRLVREEGLRGLLRGVEVQVVRGCLGAGTQLPAYNLLKRHVSDAEEMGALALDPDSPLTHTVCSLASAGVSILACNPADVVRTRIYNQPFDTNGRGLSYRHGLDCLVQTVRSEGPLALYKGGGTHFARLGPHIVLVFVFLEQFKKWS